jgi:hypothetical protein
MASFNLGRGMKKSIANQREAIGFSLSVDFFSGF